MSFVEKYSKIINKNTMFEDFEVGWNLSFGQGDYVNLYGYIDEDIVLKYIKKFCANPYLYLFIERYFEVTEDMGFESLRHLSGGNNESMCTTSWSHSELLDYLVDCRDRDATDEECENFIPKPFVNEIAIIISKAFTEIQKELDDRCSLIFSKCSSFYLACYVEESTIINKTIGDAEVVVSVNSIDDPGFILEHCDNVTFIDEIIEKNHSIFEVRVYIAAFGSGDSFFHCPLIGPKDSIEAIAKECLKESISTFRDQCTPRFKLEVA